jgi:hypothetical protein
MEWEKSYLHALVDALQPSGDVLEVGFNLGFAATHIQTYQPKSHTIIEANPSTAELARQWAIHYSNVTVLNASWEKALPELGKFNAVFFDDYSVGMDTRIAHEVIHSEKELFAFVEQTIPQLKNMQYTDADLHLFYEEKGKYHPQETARFLVELKQRGQISLEQYDRMLSDYHLEKISVSISTSFKESCCIFLETCLHNHMHPGSRFSCFSSNPASKYEQPWFFENVITNPFLDYHEKWMPVDVPASCTYYPYATALIPLITKSP